MKESESPVLFGHHNHKNIFEKQHFHPIDPNEMIKNWFQNGADAVLFGYNHDILAVHKFMGEKLVPLLSKMHITDIFLEHSCTWQPDFEQFRQTGIYSDQWKRDLQLVRGLSCGQEDKRLLFESVRNYSDIKLTFIDAPDDRKTGWRLPLKISRDQFMHETIVQNRPKGKFLVICGSYHSERMNSKRSRLVQLIKNPKLDTLGIRLRKYSGCNIRSLIASDIDIPGLYPLKEYFDNIFPDGCQPFALDFNSASNNQNNVIKYFKYHHLFLHKVFDGMIFFRI